MKVYIHYTYDYKEKRSKEPYGQWSKKRSNHEVHYVTLDGETDDYFYDETMTYAGEAKVGDTLYLVYALVSHGDSFGNSTGNFEPVGIYGSEKKAIEVRDKILDMNKHGDRNDFGYARFVDPDGLPVSTSSWEGYFDSLEDVEIAKLVVVE